MTAANIADWFFWCIGGCLCVLGGFCLLGFALAWLGEKALKRAGYVPVLIDYARAKLEAKMRAKRTDA